MEVVIFMYASNSEYIYARICTPISVFFLGGGGGRFGMTSILIHAKIHLYFSFSTI